MPSFVFGTFQNYSLPGTSSRRTCSSCTRSSSLAPWKLDSGSNWSNDSGVGMAYIFRVLVASLRHSWGQTQWSGSPWWWRRWTSWKPQRLGSSKRRPSSQVIWHDAGWMDDWSDVQTNQNSEEFAGFCAVDSIVMSTFSNADKLALILADNWARLVRSSAFPV